MKKKKEVEPPANPQAEFKKKIATMGGVNIFGGFDPMGGLNSLKNLRKLSTPSPAKTKTLLAGQSASTLEDGDPVEKKT